MNCPDCGIDHDERAPCPQDVAARKRYARECMKLGLTSTGSRFARLRGTVMATNLLNPIDGWERIERRKFPPGSVGAVEVAKDAPPGTSPEMLALRMAEATTKGAEVRFLAATVPFDWRPE